jgi:SAM-dependent methyltransferase
MSAACAFRRPCPVCGSGQGERLARLRFAAFEDGLLPSEFDLAGCPGCGLAFYDADFSAGLLAAHYGRSRPAAAGAAPGGGGVSAGDRDHYRDILSRLAAWAAPDFGRPVWEVGCGAGGLLAALREAGYPRLLGVELWPEAVEQLAGRGFPAAVGSALDLPGGRDRDGAPPGLLIYSHILEHLADPRAALREAARRLTPGGLIYVEVPDAAVYDPAAPYRELYQEHLSHFDETSLGFLLRNNGFEIRGGGRGRLGGGAVIWAVASLQDGRPTAGPGAAGPGEEAGRREGLPALRGYLRACARHPVLTRLSALAAEGRPWLIWGLSQQTLYFLGSTELGRADIRGLADADPSKQGRRVRLPRDPSVAGEPSPGWVVRPPESLARARPGEGVVLAAWGRGEEMRAGLKALGFSGPVVGLDEGEK